MIAAINGHAIGVGMTLAIQCDLRFMAADAKYGVVQTRRGVMGDAFVHWSLPRIVGHGERGRDPAHRARRSTATRCSGSGWPAACCRTTRCCPAAWEYAREMAVNTAPMSVAFSKRCCGRASSSTATRSNHLETELHHHLMGSADAREGVMAFLERRDPQWQGSVATTGRESGPERDWS